MRMRRKRNIISRMGRCEDLLVAHPEQLHGKWLSTYGYNELHVELGCGKGRFIVESSKAEPDVLFAAFEKSDNVIVAAAELAMNERVKNVLFVNALADNLCNCFAPGEITKIYINFCDPWPANRHIKRRLVSPRFLDIYKRVLCKDGILQFKTDNVPLFDYALSEFKDTGFTIKNISRDFHKNGISGIITEYEQRFITQGIPICFLSCLNSNSGI